MGELGSNTWRQVKQLGFPVALKIFSRYLHTDAKDISLGGWEASKKSMKYDLVYVKVKEVKK